MISDVMQKRDKFQEYYVLKDCAFCHDSVNFTEIAKSKPRAVRCNICRLHRVYPRINRDGQLAMLKQNQLYTDEEIQASWGKPEDIKNYSPAIKTIKKYLPSVFMGGRVLDVGCANGGFVQALKHAGANPTGLEQVGKLANLGKDHGLDIRDGRFETEVMSSYFNEHSFDLICFMESIEYMPDWRKVFDLINTYLRPSGGLYIKSHSANSTCYIRNRDLEFRKTFHGGVPTRKTYIYILESEGFRIHEAGYWPENVFHTMGASFAYSLAAKIINKFLSPLVNFIERGDRVFICASLPLQ